MFTLQVTVDKLNIRNSPQPDPTFANWIGDLAKGTLVNCTDLVQGGTLENNNNWYVDQWQNYYWAGGLLDITGNPSAADQSSVYPWWIALNGLDTVWQKTKGKGIKIGILDSGIDNNHPALAASIKKMTFSAYPPGVANGSSLGSTNDTLGHGTECAGMVAGFDSIIRANCCGVAPEVDLYIYKIHNEDAGDKPEFLVTGLTDAINDKVDIISLSRPSILTPDIQDKFQEAVNNKIFVVVAGGNSNESANPLMAASGIIKIGAINSIGNDSWKNASINAESETTLSCYAPGINISSTAINGEFVTDTGCSFATPFVAGIIALKLSLTDRSNGGFYDNIINEFFASVQPNSSQFKTLTLKTFLS